MSPPQVDPDARHTRKSPEARRDGYRAHVAAEPETGIITDEALTEAAGTENSDAAVAEQFLAADTAGNNDGESNAGGACEWYGDSAYGTGDFRYAIGQAGHAAVIKPKPLQSAVENGFTVDLSGLRDYPDVDAVGREVCCSAGVSGTACTAGSG